jgi:hypothetical protein
VNQSKLKVTCAIEFDERIPLKQESLLYRRFKKRYVQKNVFIFKRSKIATLCISTETVEVAFFVTFQILGVEMSTGGSTEFNVRSFEALNCICYRAFK